MRRVAYRVENTREGQVLDYDKLIIEVETNGTIRPEDAIAYAARILQDQLQVFITFEEPKAKKEGAEKPDLLWVNVFCQLFCPCSWQAVQ